MTNTLSSRFPTRIHLLDIGTAPQITRLELVAPQNPDVLLEDPVVHEKYAADNYFPYWPIIWPSGLMLADRILHDVTVPPMTPPNDARAIELGCGLGLAGIAAARRGWNVLFTDYDTEAITFAEHNARRNGIAESQIRVLNMDWRAPVAEKFPWVIASDVLYERRLHALLLGAIDALLAPGGTAWVSDPQRTAAEDFPIAAVEHNFRVTSSPLSTVNPTGGVLPGTLFSLTRFK